MSILFISDLHLRPDQPEQIQNTIGFLAAQAPNIDQLYILGDLFNTWLGDDIVPTEYDPLIKQLFALHQVGIQSYLMVGNRDFMMGQQFAQRCGMQLLPDLTVIELAGQAVLLAHGDSFCIDDVAYQRYRRWTRNRFLQWCFLALPKRKRQAISDKIKQKSREQKQTKSAVIMDVNAGEVDRIMVEYKVHYLIHGHTHRPAIHALQDNRHRIVLGDWQPEPSYLLFDGYQFELVDPREFNTRSTLALDD